MHSRDELRRNNTASTYSPNPWHSPCEAVPLYKPEVKCFNKTLCYASYMTASRHVSLCVETCVVETQPSKTGARCWWEQRCYSYSAPFYLTPYATTMLNVSAPLIAVVVVVLNSRRQEALWASAGMSRALEEYWEARSQSSLFLSAFICIRMWQENRRGKMVTIQHRRHESDTAWIIWP